jgi:hypothetical protein
MASPAQIAANRANAKKSTGPRTVEGKQRASMSALQHGLAAQTVVLPHEDSLAYDDMRMSLYNQHEPATPDECMLVDQLAAAWWRTVRVRQIETDMLDLQIQTLNNAHPKKKKSKTSDRQALAVRFVTEDEKDFRNFMRYDAAIERAFYRALNSLQKLQAARLRAQPRASTSGRAPVTPTINNAIGFVPHAAAAPSLPQAAVEIGFVSQTHFSPRASNQAAVVCAGSPGCGDTPLLSSGL